MDQRFTSTSEDCGTLLVPAKFIDAPDSYAAKVPEHHEENVAMLFETIARFAHSKFRRSDDNNHFPRPVPSLHDRLGKHGKPDVAILQDATDISSRLIGDVYYARCLADDMGGSRWLCFSLGGQFRAASPGNGSVHYCTYNSS